MKSALALRACASTRNAQKLLFAFRLDPSAFQIMTFYFDPANFSLTRDEDGVLRLHQHGQSARLSTPRRTMPLSQPESFVALMDEDGAELGIVRAPAELDEASRKLLDEELQVAYRIERIVRVLKLEKEALTGQTRWQVEIAADKTESDEDDSATHDGTTQSNGANATGAASQNGANGAGANAASTRDSIFSLRASDDKNDETPGVIERMRRKRRANSADDETLFGDMNVSESEEREFFINGQEDVQTARYPHIFIVDTDRNRYEILDCEALDIESRRAAERFL